MLLTLISNAVVPTSLQIADGTSTPPYALVSDQLDWGNAQFEHSYSAPRGTQGARPSAGIPQNRMVTLQLRVYGTTKDNLAANVRNLANVLDEFRQFGGVLAWQSANQSYQQYLQVLTTNGANLGAWGNRAENRNIAVVDLSLVCAPYATGDAMDVSDTTFFTLANYTLDNGSVGSLSSNGSALKASSNATTEYRLVHTQRGYDVGDVEVTVAAKPVTTITNFKAGAMFWRSSSTNYWVAYVDDNGTNSRLRIDQVTGGSVSNQATTNLGSRVASGTTFYVRSRTEGTSVVAEYWTAAPTPMGTPTASVSPGTSPSTAGSGKCGAVFTPQSTSAELDSLDVRPFTYARRALPSKISPNGTVPGDAPALAQVEVTTRQALPWFLFAWQAKAAASGLSSSPTPRAAFTVFNGSDDVSSARSGMTSVDGTLNQISTPAALTASATFSGLTYTYTTSVNHGLSTGTQVLIAGMTPTAYNGTYAITVTASNKFTVSGLTTPSTNSTVSGSVLAFASSSGTYSAQYALDPSLLPTDAYADGDRAIEVWALVKTDASSKLLAPRITASLTAAAGDGVTRYTDEWGSSGRPMPTASVGASSPVLRWTRLGTIHVPVSGAREMRLTIAISPGSGSSGAQIGLARVVLAPVRQRAALPTGLTADSTYPAWSTSATETVKRVDSDLTTSSYQPASSSVALSERSLSGSLLELDPGATDFVVVASAIVPDDAAATTATEYLVAASPPTSTSAPSATVHVAVTPRFEQLRS